MSLLTTTTTTTADADLAPAVPFPLYRDVHKGVRADLFGLTLQAGSTDPSSADARSVLADHVRHTVGFLVVHAGHEDAAIQPALEQHLPELAQQIAWDHPRLEARMDRLVELAAIGAEAPRAEQRLRMDQLHLELARFTSAYLEHQDFEERVVMPALDAAVGLEAVIAIHRSIIGSIPPDEMAASLAIMLPAMNLDDRAEVLGDIQANAPAPVFEGVWGLAGSVLRAEDHHALGVRLGIA